VKIAVLGGGQLGRMLALAAHPLGLGVRCLDPSSKAPAGAVAELVVGAFDDEAALGRLAEGCERGTYELENLPIKAGEIMASRMLSVLAVRSAEGEIRRWPLVENHHVGGILIASIAPAPRVDPTLEAQAAVAVTRLMEALNYVGVLALETFHVGDALVANEMA